MERKAKKSKGKAGGGDRYDMMLTGVAALRSRAGG